MLSRTRPEIRPDILHYPDAHRVPLYRAIFHQAKRKDRKIVILGILFHPRTVPCIVCCFLKYSLPIIAARGYVMGMSGKTMRDCLDKAQECITGVISCQQKRTRCPFFVDTETSTTYTSFIQKRVPVNYQSAPGETRRSHGQRIDKPGEAE